MWNSPFYLLLKMCVSPARGAGGAASCRAGEHAGRCWPSSSWGVGTPQPSASSPAMSGGAMAAALLRGAGCLLVLLLTGLLLLPGAGCRAGLACNPAKSAAGCARELL